jgi:hypothetical protein
MTPPGTLELVENFFCETLYLTPVAKFRLLPNAELT